MAVKDGQVPKARKALFLMEHSCLRKGAPRKDHLDEMKCLGKLWATLPDAEKKHYHQPEERC